MSIREALPSTVSRVKESTAAEINIRIRRETDERVRELADQGMEAMGRRLRELEFEWDVERLLEANAATLALAGVLLGTTVNRKFLIVPGVVTAFLLQHALQGWCPPVPLFRRLGIRTSREIEHERHALKTLRGDYEGAQGADEALAAARA